MGKEINGEDVTVKGSLEGSERREGRGLRQLRGGDIGRVEGRVVG